MAPATLPTTSPMMEDWVGSGDTVVGGAIEPDMQIGKVGESVVKGESGGRSSGRNGQERNIGTQIRVGLISDIVKGSMGLLPLPLPIIVTLGMIAS